MCKSYLNRLGKKKQYKCHFCKLINNVNISLKTDLLKVKMVENNHVLTINKYLLCSGIQILLEYS
jgi:hypothetical protein